MFKKRMCHGIICFLGKRFVNYIKFNSNICEYTYKNRKNKFQLDNNTIYNYTAKYEKVE